MTLIPMVNLGQPVSSATYDAWNRLVELSTPYDPLVYEYDGLNRRIVRDHGGIGGDKFRFYYNEGWQLLEERREVSGSEVANPVGQYVWHPYYIDALAVRYFDEDTDNDLNENNDGPQYYLQDANYNVTAVTEDSGTVLERYAYTPYGEVTFLEDDFDVAGSQYASAIGNNHLYTGRERDPATGLQLNRNRYYASHLGMWNSRDPENYADSYNLYEYVRSQPTINVDPQGTDCPGCDGIGDLLISAQRMSPS